RRCMRSVSVRARASLMPPINYLRSPHESSAHSRQCRAASQRSGARSRIGGLHRDAPRYPENSCLQALRRLPILAKLLSFTVFQGITMQTVTRHQGQSKRSSRWRLEVEPLEDRITVSTIYGLTPNNIFLRFDSSSPGTIQAG